MTKLKDFSDEFDVPYIRENNPWISRLQCSQAVELSSRGNLVKSEFYRAFEAAVRKQGLIGSEVGDSLLNLSSPVV